jgi:hypothetical protein
MGQSEVHCQKTQEVGVAKWTICVDQMDSHTEQVGEAVQEEDVEVWVGGNDGDIDRDRNQREPYCPGMRELTLPKYLNIGYKQHSSKHIDMQLWRGLESKPTMI